jgi:DNA-binding NtrC family response regulator
MQINARGVFEKPAVYPSDLHAAFTVLLVSANFETRRAIDRVLEALSVQVISCSTLSQARQALSVQRPNLIFCDERLADGSYEDVLNVNYEGLLPPPVVVLTRTGEWEFYMDATRRGAFDVIRSPWCPTDIELSMIRAAREEKQNGGRATRPASLAQSA